jgi:hypothetical protein
LDVRIPKEYRGQVIGRRRPDLPLDQIHPDLKPGDYWKILNVGDGKPRVAEGSPENGNLTGTCWFVVVPLNDGDGTGFGLGRLEHHTVREEEDGTISVRPGDGSSNSILVTGAHGKSWHGYIERGEFREA